MKSLLLALFAAALPFMHTVRAESAPGRTYIVGVSPHLDKSDRESAFKALVMLALEGGAPGDVIVVYDALHLQPLARLAIPQELPSGQNSRARFQKMKAEIARLQKFFATDGGSSSEYALIHVPQFLALVGSQLRPSAQPLTVILVGSPCYLDAAEPAFDMTEGRYPSDGHLLADQKASVFGVAAKKDALKGVTVHYGYLQERFANDDVRNRIQRFWTLFVGGQGGMLASFASDLPLVFQRASQNVQQPCMNVTLDREDAAIVMHSTLQREMPVTTAVRHVETPLVRDPAPVVPTPPAPLIPTPALEVRENESELKINMVGDILFDFGKAEIRAAAEPALEQVVAMIQKHPGAQVLVEGFTDGIGQVSYNLKLSDRRASAVKTWLVTKGIPEQSVWSRGRGADCPIAPNTRGNGADYPEGRQKNRRVEITVKK